MQKKGLKMVIALKSFFFYVSIYYLVTSPGYLSFSFIKFENFLKKI